MTRNLIVLFCLTVGPLMAQSGRPYPRQTIFAELGGNGLGYSLNYERGLSPTLTSRLGISWLRVTERGTGKAQTIVTLPLTASYLIQAGSSPHHLELGGGLNVVYATGNLTERKSTTDVFPNLTGIFGYRYQRPTGGLLFKAAFTPHYGMKTLTNAGGTAFSLLNRFQPWGGISIGYGF